MAIAPSADMIEAAAESLDALSSFVRGAQIKELRSFGDASARMLGASGVSDDFELGYELGLQTARELLATLPAAITADVTF